MRAGNQLRLNELVRHLQIAARIKAHAGMQNMRDLRVGNLLGRVGVRRIEKLAARIVVGDKPLRRLFRRTRAVLFRIQILGLH